MTLKIAAAVVLSAVLDAAPAFAGPPPAGRDAMKRAIALVAGLLLVLSSTPAAAARPKPAPDPVTGYSCTGSARGVAGDLVSISFDFDINLQPASSIVLWYPAATDGVSPADAQARGMPSLVVRFDLTADDNIGEAQAVGTANVFMHPDFDAFNRGGVRLRIDGREWRGRTSARGAVGITSVYSALAERSEREPVNLEIFDTLDTANSARLRLYADASIFAERTFDLSARDSREALFPQALSAARAAAANPAGCLAKRY